jgi:hypothetical protein
MIAIGARSTYAQATVNNSISFRYFLNEGSALEALVSFGPLSIGGLYEVYRPLVRPACNGFSVEVVMCRSVIAMYWVPW